jgi:transposase-like protein
LFKDAIEEVLESEISEHLGYEKYDSLGDNTGNSRNGYSKKTIKSQLGETAIDIPRDRNGEFEPQIIKKYEKNANELEEQILAMYAKGMSTRDIESHLKDIYGIDVSSGLVSRVTERIMPLVTEWQARPLEHIYSVIFFDAIYFKVRKDNKVVGKAAYTVLGIDMKGQKDILASGSEKAKVRHFGWESVTILKAEVWRTFLLLVWMV